MAMIKRALYWSFVVALVLPFVSCDKEPIQGTVSRKVIIHASIASEGDATKTAIHDDAKVYFDPKEHINVYSFPGILSGESPYNFVSLNDTPAAAVDFSGEVSGDDGESFLALYPATGSGSDSYWGTKEQGVMKDGQISGYLSSVQNEAQEYDADNSRYHFSTSGNVMMVAKTSDIEKMSFKSVCSGLKFSVSSEGYTEIMVKGNNGESIAGDFVLGFDDDSQTPEITISDEGQKTVFLKSSSSDGFLKGEWLYLLILPRTFEKGITISFKKDGQWVGSVILENSLEFKRGIWKKAANIDGRIKFDPNLNIIFEDSAAKDFCVKKWDTNGDGEISYAEAASVATLGQVSSSITSFNELKYFTGITSLEYLTFSSSTTFWGNFRMCEKLKSVSFPNTLKTIGRGCFIYCKALTDLVLPSSVEELSYEVFSSENKLTNLNTVTVMSATPPNIVSISASFGAGSNDGFSYKKTQANKLSDNSKITTVYVPAASLDEYKSNAQWSTFADRMKAIE